MDAPSRGIRAGRPVSTRLGARALRRLSNR